jgi:hypothetical protein
MKTSILKGLEDDVKEEVRMSFTSSLIIRRRLSEVIQSKIDSQSKSALLTDGYECPNWAFKQADTVGYNRALTEVLSLLDEKLS